jgi:16S rRNA (cytidine1402-2'-O)-methyltransferase
MTERTSDTESDCGPETPIEPGLYLVSTPIGNLEDVSLRMLKILGAVDALACEDTRLTRRIFARHGIRLPKTVFSCHAHNEARAVERILGLLAEGLSVALVSDAGTPAVSDPGQRVAAAAIEADHRVVAIPGASAVTTAIAVAGLPCPAFTFLGFPPRRPGRVRKFFAAFADTPSALVFFESPFRIAATLKLANEVLGARQAAVCLELTKKFERVHRDTLDALAEDFSGKTVKGEVTVVIAPAPRDKRRAGPDHDD